MPAKPKKKPLPTALIAFLLDRSGSMQMCKAATIEGFNAYLEVLKEEKGAAISFTFLQFDSHGIDKCAVNEPVEKVDALTDKTYQPRAGTPLIDAAVKTIHAVDAALKTRDDKPKVMVCIQTDGQENESREHTWEELKGLVEAKTAEGWEFKFMGAGIEGYDQAIKMGIAASHTMSYDAQDRGATRAAFRCGTASNDVSFAAGRLSSTAYTVMQKAAAGDKHAAKWDARVSVGPLHVDLTVTPVAKPKSSVDDFTL